MPGHLLFTGTLILSLNANQLLGPDTQILLVTGYAKQQYYEV